MPKFKIEWLPQAAKDLLRLREFIAEHNPQAARRAATLIAQGGRKLMDSPHIGRPTPELEAFRDLIIPFGGSSYTLRYRIENQKVIIVRVWHDREHKH
jgi:toxin ParE1/3/4